MEAPGDGETMVTTENRASSVSPLHPLWMANVLPQGCRGQLYATGTRTVVFEASVF